MFSYTAHATTPAPEKTIEEKAAEKLITRANENHYHLPYLRDDMVQIFHSLKNKGKRALIGRINGYIEEEIEKKYHVPVWYEIHGKTAYMFGKIYTGIEKTTKDMLRKHPEVKIIKLIYIPGSHDDFENFQTIHFLRQYGIITYLPRR